MSEVKVKASDMRDGAKRGKKAVVKGGYTKTRRGARPPKGPPQRREEPDDDEVDNPPPSDALAHAPMLDIRSWPTRAEACRRVGVSKTTLINWEKKGEIEYVVDEQGFHRFNPEELDVMAEGRNNDATVMMGQSVAMVVQTSTDLTQKAQNHAQAFADKHLQQSDIAFEQMRLMTSEIREENISLRTYIRELETERREKNKEIEEAQTKVHARKLEEMKQQTSDRRVDWALSTLANLAGPAIMAKLNLTPGAPLPGVQAPALTEGQAVPPPVTGPGIQPGETVDDYLRRLETNCIILICNIDEARFKLLGHVATPEEVAALTEVRDTIEKLRERQKAQ